MSLSLLNRTLCTPTPYPLAHAYTVSSITSKMVVELRTDCLIAKEGDVLSMHQTATFHNGGRTFNSSRERGSPFEFKFGASQVIRGWDEGLKGMGVGEGRTLTLPPAYVYGSGIASDHTLQRDARV